MPRGGHMGLWKPTPRDIFKSRWKRFYKWSYRRSSVGNNVEKLGPHMQSDILPDGVPSPWKLNYSRENFPPSRLPMDLRRSGDRTYRMNLDMYLRAATMCREGTASDVILRCLDAGRRNSTAGHSGLGRLEANWGRLPAEREDSRATQADGKAGAPAHILSLLQSSQSKESTDRVLAPCTNLFQVRRLYQLCAEKEIIWDNGLNDPRRYDKDEGAGSLGRFPYIDEQAGLLDELQLREILRLSHRRKERRHPKWKEIQFWFKKWRSQYLRRREILKDEVKARMGLLKQGIE
eukprot:TRINITY_DN95417_c0_g1_i1.p1 TRINITY_DN95417_c0_g1~~TRINITY_DN95417_c0_g1_i1.p1  ORF type:complete len:312 (+),score=69.97 TRINITY_DN95417_c0_g1_i1:66-938(+)